MIIVSSLKQMLFAVNISFPYLKGVYHVFNMYFTTKLEHELLLPSCVLDMLFSKDSGNMLFSND